MGFVAAGMLMIGLGLLGFFGAKKIAPRALWIQVVGSLAIVLIVFGGINQVFMDQNSPTAQVNVHAQVICTSHAIMEVDMEAYAPGCKGLHHPPNVDKAPINKYLLG